MAKSKKADKKSAKPVGRVLPKKKIRRRNQVAKGKNGGMLIVLVEDVDHLGKQGDLVEVKPGYGRNYLLPNSLAIVPTAHNLKRLEAYKIKVEKAREVRQADLKVTAEQLTRLQLITIEANATEDGHLYGSIGPIEVSKFLKGKNLMVEADMVKMDHPIKEANTVTEVPLHLGYGIETKIQVLVVALAQAVKK